jgi:transcription-repair coupling factor (superfamily II helicase)
VRGYAYLTLPPGRLLSSAAKKRLEVMQTLDTLGAGFMVASHDMDIRGAGNLLGEEQSGHIREVGVELYQQMLEEALSALKHRRGMEQQALPRESWTPQINLGVPVLIPDSYVADLDVRLNLYRRLANLVQGAEIDGFAAELIDRFGPLPDEVQNLLSTMAIKQLCRAAGIEKIDAGPKGGVISFRDNRPADPDRLIAMIQKNSGEVRLRPDQRVVVQADWRRLDRRIGGVKDVLQKLAPKAA